MKDQIVGWCRYDSRRRVGVYLPEGKGKSSLSLSEAEFSKRLGDHAHLVMDVESDRWHTMRSAL